MIDACIHRAGKAASSRNSSRRAFLAHSTHTHSLFVLCLRYTAHGFKMQLRATPASARAFEFFSAKLSHARELWEEVVVLRNAAREVLFAYEMLALDGARNA